MSVKPICLAILNISTLSSALWATLVNYFQGMIIKGLWIDEASYAPFTSDGKFS